MIVAFALVAAAQTLQLEWPALPALPYRAPPLITPPMNDFVAREARERRCPLAPPRAGMQVVTVELAVLVEGDGNIRTVVPRAIRCPTVEQYAAGLAATFARANIVPRANENAQWYKTNLTFSWRR